MTPEQIRAELQARNMSIRDLAEATGIQENYLSKSLGRQRRRITVEEMEAIRRELTDDGAPEGIRTIPHLGKVPAGSFRAAEQRGGRRYPVDNSIPPNAYALTVSGESMNLVVDDGTVLIIDPDDKELWPGRRYVVQAADGETFKEFQADPARLVPCSDHPEHLEIKMGAEAVTVLGRVISYILRDADLPRRTS